MADEHAGHDLEAIVAFADHELTGAPLREAEAQVRSCTSCARIVEELRALSLADRALLTPPRPRDFQLTAADAERLRASSSEPLVLAARLGTEMTTTPDAHRTHDPELIAAAADGTLTGPDASRVDEWLTRCAPCADLRRDLVAIAAANRTLPTPARTRDYRLSPAEAERLRSGGLRGLLARIGTSRDAFSRPLALGLTTLGLAGLLLTGGTSIFSSGSTAGAAPQTLSTVGAAIPEDQTTVDAYERASGTDGSVFSGEGEAAASAAPSAAPAAAPDLAASEVPVAASGAPEAMAEPSVLDRTGDPSQNDGGGADASAAAEAAQRDAAERELAAVALEDGASAGTPWPIVLSTGLLLVGLALFALRWIARRSRRI